MFGSRFWYSMGTSKVAIVPREMLNQKPAMNRRDTNAAVVTSSRSFFTWSRRSR